MIINGRLRSRTKEKIFQITEDFLGYKCSNVQVNGIEFEGQNVKIDVCFREKSSLLYYQSAIRRQWGKKRQHNQDQNATIVSDEMLSRVYFHQNLVRIFVDDYDTEGDTLSIFDGEVANSKEAEVVVQMIENPGGFLLFGQVPELCHIKDKAFCNKFTKESIDPNNHIFMSRHLHQHFAGTETIPKNTPSFLIRYLSHEDGMTLTW